MFYLRPAQWKAKGNSYKHSHSGLRARLTQKQDLHMNGFIPTKQHKLGVGGRALTNPVQCTHSFIRMDHPLWTLHVLQDTAEGNTFQKPVLNILTQRY